MKHQLTALALLIMTTTVFADEMSCAIRAKDKKLAGAALNSFMTKCEKDSIAACEASLNEKKLHGAAATSYQKKCVRDKIGMETASEPSCKERAEEKKLAGAALASFMKKCEADTAAARK